MATDVTLPSLYIKEDPDWTPITPHLYAIAIQDFTSNDEGDLSLTIQDAVCITDQKDGSFRGHLLADQHQSGQFPASCVTIKPLSFINEIFDALIKSNSKESVPEHSTSNESVTSSQYSHSKGPVGENQQEPPAFYDTFDHDYTAPMTPKSEFDLSDHPEPEYGSDYDGNDQVSSVDEDHVSTDDDSQDPSCHKNSHHEADDDSDVDEPPKTGFLQLLKAACKLNPELASSYDRKNDDDVFNSAGMTISGSQGSTSSNCSDSSEQSHRFIKSNRLSNSIESDLKRIQETRDIPTELLTPLEGLLSLHKTPVDYSGDHRHRNYHRDARRGRGRPRSINPITGQEFSDLERAERKREQNRRAARNYRQNKRRPDKSSLHEQMNKMMSNGTVVSNSKEHLVTPEASHFVHFAMSNMAPSMTITEVKRLAQAPVYNHTNPQLASSTMKQKMINADKQSCKRKQLLPAISIA